MSEEMEEKKKPPPYGAQEYWEQRYQENNVALAAGKETENSDASSEDDNPSPFHSWYFSYDELKPLLLPLILGGREEMQKIMVDSTEIQEEEKERVDNDQQNDKKEVPVSNVARKRGTETTSENQVLDSENSHAEEGQNKESEIDEDNTDDNQNDDDEWEEVHGDENMTDDDEKSIDGKEEVPQSLSFGLAVKYPISILEIGCGDVPLGIDLADDLLDLEMKTGADAGLIVKQIVSTDYSPTLIDMMKRLAEKKRREPEPPQEEEDRSKLEILQEKRKHKKLPVEFSVADARELPYPAGSFHLILEKGTLDAMLSDSEVGVKNCIMIVSECARVLAVGGCLFLISHVNAHTVKGEEWLDEVVVPGLHKGGEFASWIIEVHGSDQLVEDGPGPPESPGPAVYMIFKGTAQSSDADPGKESQHQPTISLKFFTY